MHAMHIDHLDLNLLRLFDAVYRSRNVGRAALAACREAPRLALGLHPSDT